MSGHSKKEYLKKIRERYRKASKEEKISLLDEVCEVCSFNRKYAIRILNNKKAKTDTPKKRGPKKRYNHPDILKVIRFIWRKTNLPCSKRLVEILPLWLPFYPLEISEEIRRKVLGISAATIDRLMREDRGRYLKIGLATTKPGSLLKKHISVKTGQWDETKPGYLETDTVAHCGSSMAGQFAFTVNSVDIATTWTVQRAVWGKGERGVKAAISEMEQVLPFDILGFDCDNGSEFLNWHLVRFFSNRKKPVKFTRSRPYYKNDNAHIEGKNWTHIREYLGYQRFDNQQIVALMNNLYSSEWYLYFNFFMPYFKLVSKIREGAKTIKKYDKPKTPYQRILESKDINDEIKRKLTKTFKQLNPFDLQKAMAIKIKQIINLANSPVCENVES
ncbi:MAG: integrase [Calditrichaeota bacterium]|nr:integrase [Calditrichota bacterium]NOG48001.1 integrase [Calditrichota bacterium]